MIECVKTNIAIADIGMAVLFSTLLIFRIVDMNHFQAI